MKQYIISERRQDRRNHLDQEKNSEIRNKITQYSKLSKILIEYGINEQKIPVVIQIIENILGITVSKW